MESSDPAPENSLRDRPCVSEVCSPPLEHLLSAAAREEEIPDLEVVPFANIPVWLYLCWPQPPVT